MSRNPVFRKFCGIYVCDFCDYQVSSRKGLDLHMKYSHKVDSTDRGATRLHVCGVCGRKFEKYKDLSDHMRKNHRYRQ